MLFAQGRDFSGQKPDEFNAVCRRAGNKVVVPTVRHSVYGCVLPVHDLNVPFLPCNSNRIVTPNARYQRHSLRVRSMLLFQVSSSAAGAVPVDDSIRPTSFKVPLDPSSHLSGFFKSIHDTVLGNPSLAPGFLNPASGGKTTLQIVSILICSLLVSPRPGWNNAMNSSGVMMGIALNGLRSNRSLLLLTRQVAEPIG